MAWPSAQDYNDAVQNAAANFEDPELKAASVDLGPMGLPKPYSGNFASVYVLSNGAKRSAVKCFLFQISEQSQRYKAITDQLLLSRFPFTVQFVYQPHGIKVKGEWYPILKMDWVDGELLHEYVNRNIGNKDALNTVAEEWLKMNAKLKSAGVAHGDLQHSNIIVSQDKLHLIDYDGMYVPGLSKFKAVERGVEHYQHPKRRRQYGDYLDHFSQWIIYSTLVALVHEPALWNKFNGADDYMLFEKHDYKEPQSSELFKALNEIGGTPKELGGMIQQFISGEMEAVPQLNPEMVLGHQAWWDGAPAVSSPVPVATSSSKKNDATEVKPDPKRDDKPNESGWWGSGT